MRSKVAPSVANFPMYGASNLPPRICSKSLFSSTTMTMWSYIGNVGGQGSLLAAIAIPPADHTRAIVHSRGTFLMCPPSSGVEGLSDSEHVQSHDGVGSATAVLSLDGSLLAFAGTENNHAESQAYCE